MRRAPPRQAPPSPDRPRPIPFRTFPFGRDAVDRQNYSDILYEEKDHVATVTFNRPDRLNAFRAQTYYEVADAVQRAG